MEIITTMPAAVDIVPLYKETILQIHVPNEVRGEAVRLMQETAYNPEQTYRIRIEKAKKKRTLDANAYCWTLIGKLASKLRVTPQEIYREAIRDTGAYTVLPIAEDAVESFTDLWESRGIGWLVDDLGPCRRTEGYRNLRCWHGSSVYDSAEMSRLIDRIVDECKTQGVETLTPRELEEMKNAWNG